MVEINKCQLPVILLIKKFVENVKADIGTDDCVEGNGANYVSM